MLHVLRCTGDNTDLHLKLNLNLKNGKSRHCFYQSIFKEHLISFLMVCRLIDFALAVLMLLIFKYVLRSKTHHGFYDIILMILWKKELCAKFCGILVSSHDATELLSFGPGVNDVIPANVQNIFILGFLCIMLLLLWKKNLLHSLMAISLSL